tara:strand:- start:39 stop:704 length:666 start_codon:yes stop_codon:yes gene_type:complete
MTRLFNITIISNKTFEILDLRDRLSEYFKVRILVKSSLSEIPKISVTPHLIILNLINLNKISIQNLEKKIRNLTNCYFISISNNNNFLSGIYDRVKLLKIPLNLAEFLNSLDNILKKINKNSNLRQNNVFDFSIERSQLYIHEIKKTVKLTELESNFLEYLLLTNRPVSKEDILSNVWKHQRKLETHTLESLVYRLRLKIEKDPKNPKILILEGKKYLIKR